MNIKQMLNKNKLKSKIKHTSLSGNKSNMFSINLNESDEHRNKKFEVCLELIKRGYEVFTEVQFKYGGRADIVCFDANGNGFIFEIINTEEQESINRKKHYYPNEFEIFTIKCGEPIEICI